MKTKIILASIVYFGISVLVFEACCKKKCNDVNNPDCANYDPCYGKKEISANFKIYQDTRQLAGSDDMWTFHELTPSDTTSGGLEYFVAEEINADSYTWYIGKDTIRKKAFHLSFSSALNNAIVPITLIVERKNKDACTLDDGIDTFTKNIVIDRNTCLLAGKWQGYKEGDASKTLRYCEIKKMKPGTNLPADQTVLLQNANVWYFDLFNWPVDNQNLAYPCDRVFHFGRYGGGGPSPWPSDYFIKSALDGSRDKLKIVLTYTDKKNYPTEIFNLTRIK
jgi:hypothetical protein